MGPQSVANLSVQLVQLIGSDAVQQGSNPSQTGWGVIQTSLRLMSGVHPSQTLRTWLGRCKPRFATWTMSL